MKTNNNKCLENIKSLKNILCAETVVRFPYSKKHDRYWIIKQRVAYVAGKLRFIKCSGKIISF